jgi:hypothetical protein
MEQKQGGISQKREKRITKRTDRRGTLGLWAPDPKSSNDARWSGEARAPGGWMDGNQHCCRRVGIPTVNTDARFILQYCSCRRQLRVNGHIYQ